VNPKEDTMMLLDSRTSEFQEAKKKNVALLHQASHKESSLKIDLSGLFLHSVPDEIEKLSCRLVKLDLSNNNLEVGLFQEYYLLAVGHNLSPEIDEDLTVYCRFCRNL